MTTESVKGYLDNGSAAESFHSVKRGLVDEMPVGVYLRDVHSALIYLLDYLKEIFMQHRLSARESYRVNTAFLRLLQHCFRLAERPFAHQRRVVGGVKAMQTVIIAFSRYRVFHGGEVTVITVEVFLPFRQLVSVPCGSNNAVFRKFPNKR